MALINGSKIDQSTASKYLGGVPDDVFDAETDLKKRLSLLLLLFLMRKLIDDYSTMIKSVVMLHLHVYKINLNRSKVLL
jgi:hypothetical protein